jgi:RNA polymerase sigma-70 factor (family 1)
MRIAVNKDLVLRISLYDDQKAYKQLFITYYSKLLQFSHSIIHCKESAEEVVSDVFLKIWNMRQALPEISNLHLYLYITTRNLSINCLEKQKREKVYWLDESKVEFRSIYFDPEQLMITQEMFRRIRAAVLDLPPKCQMIFKLVKEDDLSYKEVADLLQLSPKTIENQMTIALKKLGNSIRFRHPQES